MAKLVSNTYGDALFELAVEENKVDALFEEMKAFKEILQANPELIALMKHPQVSSEEKEKVISDIFNGRASDNLNGFLKLIVNNGRFDEIEAVTDYFIATVKDYKKIGVAFVSSAVTLSDTQKKSVREKLLETTGYEEMEMNYSVDESLIGGMVIRIKDRVVDSSIKSKLVSLKKDLMSVQLKKA